MVFNSSTITMMHGPINIRFTNLRICFDSQLPSTDMPIFPPPVGTAYRIKSNLKIGLHPSCYSLRKVKVERQVLNRKEMPPAPKESHRVSQADFRNQCVICDGQRGNGTLYRTSHCVLPRGPTHISLTV